MAAVSLFWDTNMAAVTSFENTLYHVYPCMCPEEWGILSSPGSGGEFKPEASSFFVAFLYDPGDRVYLGLTTWFDIDAIFLIVYSGAPRAREARAWGEPHC